MNYCCLTCIQDPFLKQIIKSNSQMGICSYCENENVLVTEISNIASKFNIFIDKYYVESKDSGDTLFHLITTEWPRIFLEGLPERKKLGLFNDIMKSLNSKWNSQTLYERAVETSKEIQHIDIWEEFKNELKHENRFFIKQDLKDQLSKIINSNQYTIQPGSIFYRGRYGKQPIDRMSAPPAELATSGRANPRGISYLYTAIDRDTCIAELRPYKGAQITIATVVTRKPLNIVRLNVLKPFISPFQFNGELLEEIKAYILYHTLVNDLTKPVNPDSSEIDYLPTQYLAELIKHLGYDGFFFRSSLGPNDNYVFFDKDCVKIDSTELFQVNNIQYTKEQIID
ncbi:RES domain-containing protein [Bacillus cereus group sp. MYBK57-1]|uniref:RES domain-containing protein n=1 Tax=Bacillus cereus group sp. MYBK57-1 TaxID=3450619 RepID=UPI003F79858B